MLIHSWLNPKLEARVAQEGGKGVFAKEPIFEGERLAIFGGHVMKVTDEPVFSPENKDYGLQIDEEFIIGTNQKSEIEDSDFFNHSCNPNSGFKGQLFLVAMRNIESDEEITFDYAMVLHVTEGADVYELECLCASPNCRKKVTDSDWKIPELQQKYNGWFQWYLQEKIDKSKTHKG